MATIDRVGDWHSRKTGKYINKPWALGSKLSGLFGADEPPAKTKELIEFSKNLESEMTPDLTEDAVVGLGQKLETFLDAAIPEIDKAKIADGEALDKTLEDFETAAFFMSTPRIWPEAKEEPKADQPKAGVYPVGSAKSKTRGQVLVPRYSDEDRQRLGFADMKPEDRAEFIRLRKQYVSAATARDGVGGGVFLGEVTDLQKKVADNEELVKELQGWIDGMKKRMGVHDEEWAVKAWEAFAAGKFGKTNPNAFAAALKTLGDDDGAASVAKYAAAGDTANLNKLLDKKIKALEKAVAALETFVASFPEDGKAEVQTEEQAKARRKDERAAQGGAEEQKSDSPRPPDTRTEAEKSAAATKAAETRKAGGGEQWRAPEGSPQGGQFIDMPGSAAAKVGSIATGQKIKSLLDGGKVAEAQKVAESQLKLMDQALNSLYSMSFSAKVGAMTASGGTTVTKAKWEGPLGFEGQFTGDNRYIKPLALDWTNVTFPQPFRWASEDIGAHDGARVIGTIEGIDRLKDGTIWGYGTFDMDSELGMDAQRHVEKHLSNGVSLDLDRISAEVSDAASLASEIGNLADAVQDMNITTINSARTRSATLVALPAFEGARIEAVSSWKHEAPEKSKSKKPSKFAMQRRRQVSRKRRVALALKSKEAAAAKLASKKWQPKTSKPVLALKTPAIGSFIGIDAGGQWHATIPTKGNRWIDMPGAAMAKMYDMVYKAHSQGNDSRGPGGKADEDEAVVEESMARIQEANVKVHDQLEADDVEGAQATVQEVVDNFPFDDYTGEASDWDVDDNGDEVEVDASEQIREALEAFVEIDPQDFRDQVAADNAEGGAPEGDQAAREDAAKEADVAAGDQGDHEPDGSEGDGAGDWFVDDEYVAEWSEEDKAKFKAKLDEVKANAPEGWTFSGPSEDAPFGQFENAEGDTVTPAEHTSDFREPDESGMEFWVFSGEAFEAQTEPNWDTAIKTMEEGYGNLEEDGGDEGAAEGGDWYDKASIGDYYDPEDWDEDTQAAVKAKIDDLKANAPEGYTYNEPDADNPFGSWDGKSSDGEDVSVMPAPASSDFLEPDDSGLELWVHVGEGGEFQESPDWANVIDRAENGYGFDEEEGDDGEGDGGSGVEGDADGDGKTGAAEAEITAEEAGSKGGTTTSPWKSAENPPTKENPKRSEWSPELIADGDHFIETPAYKVQQEAYFKDTLDSVPNVGKVLDALEASGLTGWQGSVGYHKGQWGFTKTGYGYIGAGPGGISVYAADSPRVSSTMSMKHIGDFKDDVAGALKALEEYQASKPAKATKSKKSGKAADAPLTDAEKDGRLFAGRRRRSMRSENREDSAMSLVASGAKLAAPIAPPAAWFENPNFKTGTPLTVTREGRVFGHLALWGTCHAAFGGEAGNCVSVPSSETNYSLFHLGVVETAEGTEVPVGRLAMETGHANDQFGSRKAIAHYENTGLAIADIHAGEDEFGIWISGALRPDATPSQVRALKASPLSGDWRHHPGTNNLELVMALAVNMPGFAVPRPQFMVASGAVRTLTAAGLVPPKTVSRAKVDAALAGDKLALSDIRFLKKLAARERANEAKALKQRALVASGAPDKIHALAQMLKAKTPVEGKK